MEGASGVSMFFDSGCGPCTFFAQITAAFSRSPVGVHPLDGPDADHALQAMTPQTRFGYFHIVEPGRIWTGPDAMPAWVGLIGGRSARRVVERSAPIDRLLRWIYNDFWEYRRSHGCAAGDTRRA
jgi:hypothetical protein